MNQIVAIALGGAFGAVMRYIVSTGVYQWLGRDFPYGTLTVNVVGSFLIGLLTEALVLQKVSLAMEHRAAILVGVLGSFTTFSTFSLDTFYLFQQGSHLKALANVFFNVSACLVAVWLGLLSGRSLFVHSSGVFRWFGMAFPYGVVLVNFFIAFLIGLVMGLLLHKSPLNITDRAALLFVLTGVYITFSSLYLVMYLIEDGYPFHANLNGLLSVFLGNGTLCFFALWGGLTLGK